MDRISSMKAFVRVVDTGSLSEAARQLGLSKSAVAKQVGALESLVGRPLLHRSTRAVRKTAEGVALLPTLVAADALTDGRLGRLLPGWEAERLAIHAAYPTTHRGNPRIRALLDFLAATLAPVPPWDREIS